MRRSRVRLWWRGPRRGWYWSVTHPGLGPYGAGGSLGEARSAVRTATSQLGRLRRASALGMMLALAGVGCQAGMPSAGPGGRGGSPSASAPTVSVAVPTASVPAPAGGGTYVAFCGAGAGCPSGGVPTALRRPIRLPHVAAGTRCPVSAPARKVDPNEGAVIGPGPIYAFSLWLFRHPVIPFVLPSPVLFRGRKLTGRDGLGFGGGKVPLAEMDVPGGPAGGVGLNPGGWRLWSGY